MLVTHRLEHNPDQPDHQPSEIDRLIGAEWVLGNGTGAYAMGTAAGVPTRRYHGLLVAAAQPPVARVMALSQVWERLVLPGHDQPIGLNTLLFDGASDADRMLSPRGVDTLTHFEKGTAARWTHRVGEWTITKTLRLHWKTQAATLQYQLIRSKSSGKDKAKPTDENATPFRLLLSPMLALRDFHAMRHEGDAGHFDVDDRGRGVLSVGREGHAVTMKCLGPRGEAAYRSHPHWWGGVCYPRDAYRGQESWEDLFVPGTFEVELSPGEGVTLTAALGDEAAEPILDDGAEGRLAHLDVVRNRLRERLVRARASLPKIDIGRLADVLAIAADDFVVDRAVKGEMLSTILAGYPWFADWGRDTFIALPGLLLTTGRHAEARAVLKAFADAVGSGEHEGLVPNRFDDYGEDPHYNTVDASLWYVHAALLYIEATNDRESWSDFLEAACTRILDAYAAGTGGPLHADDPAGPRMIRLDEDGLITAGHEGTQLTWMDAACPVPDASGRWRYTVFTPRAGKCVEINALWHSNLLGVARLLGRDPTGRADRYRAWADRCRRRFVEAFWDPDRGDLADRITPAGDPDTTLRPNQGLAIGLERSPLPRDCIRPCLDAMRRRLLTPVGPRTLPPGDPHYHPHYEGAADRRDAAYHQGIAWPWLIGGYCEGILRAAGGHDPEAAAAAAREAAAALAPLLASLLRHPPDAPQGLPSSKEAPPPGGLESLGHLYEIHDADAPHTGRGCPAQAWSVAEPLRVLSLLAG